jgi:hypothetical protein
MSSPVVLLNTRKLPFESPVNITPPAVAVTPATTGFSVAPAGWLSTVVTGV